MKSKSPYNEDLREQESLHNATSAFSHSTIIKLLKVAVWILLS